MLKFDYRKEIIKKLNKKSKKTGSENSIEHFCIFWNKNKLKTEKYIKKREYYER
jgi:hypothetical protein